MDRFRTYLFERHTEEELRRWAVSLSHFRFCRAYGGHTNDSDQFLVAIRYTNEADYFSVLGSLNLSPNILPPDNPRPEPGELYTHEKFRSFRSEVDDFPTLEQIGRCQVAGNECFAWASNHRMTISVVGDDGNPYDVSEDDFQRAYRIDSHLHMLADRVIDPPRDDRNCICPKYYPAYWQDTA